MFYPGRSATQNRAQACSACSPSGCAYVRVNCMGMYLAVCGHHLSPRIAIVFHRYCLMYTELLQATSVYFPHLFL